MLEDLNRHSEQSPVDLVLEYIHTHYSDKIILEDLTKCAYLNRVSLNKMFQERCGCTAMGYLLLHRLKVAGNLLTHTDMTLNEIARATGFEYDTYFIKQFTAKKACHQQHIGKSPVSSLLPNNEGNCEAKQLDPHRRHGCSISVIFVSLNAPSFKAIVSELALIM